MEKISIIIPSFNQVDFLKRALHSLSIQEYSNIEVIVVDGGSSDGTVNLLKSHSNLVTHWVSEPDRGQTHALIKGFSMASGDIFGWLNCDEQYLPYTLKLVAQTFAEDPRLEIVFGHRIVVDKDGCEIGRMKMPAIHPLKYAIYAAGLMFSDTTFWKADIHRQTGKLDEDNCPRYGMDYDWFARLGCNVKKWKRLNAYLSEFTEYEGRITKNVDEMPEIAYRIRRRVQELAGISSLKIILWAPVYFILSRYGQFGWKGLLRPPKLSSLLRIAGIVK